MHILYLLIVYYNHAVLLKIEKLIKVDDVMSLISRGHFARIYVDVDLEKSLISKFELSCMVRQVEYKVIHLIIFFMRQV